MSTLRFFLAPDRFFGLLRDASKARPFRVTLRRFQSAAAPAGLDVVSLERDDIASLYATGGYREVLLSLDVVPTGALDWEFTSRAADQLIVSDGGRVQERILELSTLRVLAKKSRAQELYRELRRAIVDQCSKGLYSGPTWYDDIYYRQEDAADFELRDGLETTAHRFRPKGAS